MIDNFGIFGLVGASLVLVIIVLLLILIFEIWMFVHVILNPYIDSNRRILWVIGMLLIHPFVALIYLFTDYRRTGQ